MIYPFKNLQLETPNLDQALPEKVKSKDGLVVIPRDMVWQGRDAADKIKINFEPIAEIATAELLLSLKQILVWYLRNGSLATVKIATIAFTDLLQSALEISENDDPYAEVTSSMLMNYRVEMNGTRTSAWRTLKGILKQWYAMGYSGITKDAIKYLEKNTDKSKPKGQAVATLCPIWGPFSVIERDEFDAKLHAAFASEKLTDLNYAMLFLVRIFGARPMQFATMKACDVIRQKLPNDEYAYYVQIPSVKKKQTNRVGFKTRLLNTDFGEFLYSVRKQLEHRFSEVLADPSQAPLFPCEKVIKNWEPISGYEYHRTRSSMGVHIRNTATSLGCVSDRTGIFMNMAPVRFRRTVATVMAEEGQAPEVIAEFLDHANIQNVLVYAGITGKLHYRFNKAMALRMAPIAQAFSGLLVSRVAEPEIYRKVRVPELTGTYEPIANCGKFGFCKFNAPIACYTCSSFRPFTDAPHEVILDFLLIERERFLSSDSKTLAVIEDRTIVAVAEVVSLCTGKSTAEILGSYQQAKTDHVLIKGSY